MPQFDQAHEWTDEQIEDMSRRISREYRQASKEMRKRLDEWPEEFERKRSELQSMLDANEISRKEFNRRVMGLQAHEKWLGDMVMELSAGAMSTTERAMQIVNNDLPKVFAYGMNYSTYQIESQSKANTMYTLIDEDTVRLLVKEDRDLLPHVDVDKDKAEKWNSQKFQSAITQGILQGESIPAIGKRLQSVMGMNENASIRAARTACTGAENAGRTQAYKRANDLGIETLSEWRATLDDRTRQSHRQMNGERVKPGELFSNKCHEPGDPTGPAEEVWNCRCALVPYVVGTDYGKNDGRWYLDETIDGKTYEEWAASKVLKADGQNVYKYTNESSPIWGQLGDNDPIAVRQKVEQMLNGSAGNVAEVWHKYEAQLKMFDPNGTEGDFFRWGDGVSVHLANEMEGKGVQGNVMGTFFHEFGHHIDNIVNDAIGVSNAYGHEKEDIMLFPKTIVKEVSAAVDKKKDEIARRMKIAIDNADIDELVSIGAININTQPVSLSDIKFYLEMLDDDSVKFAEEDLGLSLSGLNMHDRRRSVFDYYVKQGLSVSMPDKTEIGYQLGLDITRGGHDMQLAISDIYEGATKGVVFDTIGHGTTYWRADNDIRLAKEAFAEFFSAECIYSENPRVLDIMKEYLPESYSVFREIMESIV